MTTTTHIIDHNLAQDEAGRLAALRALRVLDTAPTPELDVVTTLASERFDTPIALVSLVDEDRQWFKSRCGIEARETPREQSFCAHAITGTDVMVVPDAACDPRFADNPLVTGPPHIRFYAGAPLITSDGFRIGTLCVIDVQPRKGFGPRERKALQLMAGQAITILENSAIRQEQRISELISETTTDAFVCADGESRITLWNKAAETMFGYSASEALGASLDLIIPDRHQAGHHSGMARLRGGAPTRLVGRTVEVPARCKAGREIPVELSLGMWPASGEPEGFAAIIRDVSERKAAEAARAQTEAQLAQKVAAIEASDDGIAITDADGLFLFMNRAHATLFGYEDPSDLIGLPWSTLYGEAAATRISEKVMPVLAEQGQWRGEMVGRARDGAAVEQEIALSLSDEGGIVCVTRGIGDRLAMEREKARLREQLMLAQRQEAVGQLASGIAHDFNNLIAAISGSAALLEMNADEKVRSHAHRIQSAGATAAGLVDKLLSLGRRESDFKTIDLRAILSSVHDLVAPSLVDPLHRIELELPDDPITVEADATEVMQVALNLALNARDALEPGKEGRINLTLANAQGKRPVGDVCVGVLPKDGAVIQVGDSGCGIAKADLRQVFEPFYTRKGEAGTGLGLAVVAGIVADAGGAISLASRRDTGTLFEVWWPLEAPAKPVDMAAILPAEAHSLSGKAILVVDDNTAVVDTLVAMLEQAGAEPGPCLHPADALDAVSEEPDAFDLVITDYDMPEMTGAELGQALRALRPDLPLLLLTALPLGYGRRAGEAEPFDAVLGKPASIAEIGAAARLAMSKAKGRKP